MSTQLAIDKLKRLALNEILSNLGTDISSVHISKKLNTYIKEGSSVTLPFTSLFSPSIIFPTRADLQAKTLLAYLNIYSQYIINYSNSETIDSLAYIATSKYKYIFLRYKELYSLLERKKLEKSFRYTQYIDFSSPINMYSEEISTSSSLVSKSMLLSYSDMLTLPILSSKKISPDSLHAYINDSTISSISFNSDNSNIYCSINRISGNHIGTIDKVENLIINNAASGALAFSGQLKNFISNSIFIKITNIGISSITYTSSINGKDWEGSFDLTVSEEKDMLILDSLNTGLLVQLLSPTYLSVNDIFRITIEYKTLEDPSCNIKAIFNNIYDMSYITFDDISISSLSTSGTCEVVLQEAQQNKSQLPIIKTDTKSIIPINNKIYSADLVVAQPFGMIGIDGNGGVAFHYNIDISDFSAVSNTYYRAGSRIFNPIIVDGISHVSIESLNSISKSNNDIDNSFILYTLLVETDYGIAEIPVLPKDYYTINSHLVTGNSFYAVEPIIFGGNYSTDGYHVYDIKNNFIADPVYNKSKLYALNPFSAAASGTFIPNDQAEGSYSYKERDKIRINVDINRYYAYLGKIFVGDCGDIIVSNLASANNWTVMENKTAYMLYKDDNGDIQLSLKMQGSGSEESILFPFTGKIYGKITMMSADKSFVSPCVFNYSIGII